MEQFYEPPSSKNVFLRCFLLAMEIFGNRIEDSTASNSSAIEIDSEPFPANRHSHNLFPWDQLSEWYQIRKDYYIK